jgi:hypothetical protein
MAEIGAVTSPGYPQRRSTLRQVDPSMRHPGTGCMTPYKGLALLRMRHVLL